MSARIYPAPSVPLDLSALPDDATIIEVRTQDGLTLRGVAVAPRRDRAVLLALPGNASSAADAIEWTSSLREIGYGVVAVGYRGYSGNPGVPSAEGLAMDADAFLADLRERFPGRRVWIVGHSLGGAVGLDLAVRQPTDGLVTWGAFKTLRDMAPGIGRFLVPDDFRNVERLASLDSFWLLVHGTADEVVPAAQGQALHRTAGVAGRRGASVVGIGAGHAVVPTALAAVLAVSERQLDDDRLTPEGLADSWKLIPFGRGEPLNP